MLPTKGKQSLKMCVNHRSKPVKSARQVSTPPRNGSAHQEQRDAVPIREARRSPDAVCCRPDDTVSRAIDQLLEMHGVSRQSITRPVV
jgi:hypothetical protein